MSQLAYERLLEANTLLDRGDRDEAIKAYRDVLRLGPTPPQRQVAEAQLRELGELPYTFSNSGKVIRRRTEGKIPPQGKRKSPKKADSTSHVAPTASGPFEAGPPQPNRQERTILNQHPANRMGSALPVQSHHDRGGPSWRSQDRTGSRGFGGSWRQNKSSQLPQTNSEKALSKLHDLFKNVPSKEEPAPRRQPAKKASDKRPAGPAYTPKKVKEVVVNPCPIPYPPIRRAEESDEEFAGRVKRYQTWKTYQAEYPGIDINIAERLKEEGLTLKQLRFRQYKRHKKYVKRKKSRLAELREQNATLLGTNLVQDLIEKRLPLCFLKADRTELRGRLMENRLYQWLIRPIEGRPRLHHKLDLVLCHERSQRKGFRAICRVEEEQAEKGEKTSRDPSKRFQIADKDLEKSMESEQALYLRCYNGLWLKGIVLWMDPYRIGLLISDKDDEGDEHIIQGVIFRHAVNKLNKRRPAGWSDWPSLANFSSTPKS